MKIDIPSTVLKRAERITLASLLKSPATQPWAVSFLGNASKHAWKFDGIATEADEFLSFRLYKLNGAIPAETKRQCFDECGAMIEEGRR